MLEVFLVAQRQNEVIGSEHTLKIRARPLSVTSDSLFKVSLQVGDFTRSNPKRIMLARFAYLRQQCPHA
jgi:hypothetical protein